MSDHRQRRRGTDESPLVSVIMANYNGARHLEQALRSVLGQSLARIELIVSDDASDDGSQAIVEAMMAGEPRLSLIDAEANSGPAACRNRALDAARGEWVAIVDSDDLLHPERLERLLAIALRSGADIIADDLLHFYEDGSPPGFLLPLNQEGVLRPQAADWILAGRQDTPALGYLKPIIRVAALSALRYDEGLRIGEDSDLVLRLLLAGARMLVVPEPWYLYRRHTRSISHRLAAADVEKMIAAQTRLSRDLAPFAPDVAAAFALRLRDLRGARDFARLVEALKAKHLAWAFALAARRPSLLLRLAASLQDRLSRAAPKSSATHRPQLLSLGEGAGADPAQSDDLRLAVPAYDAIDRIPTGGAARRETWRRVAELGANAVAIHAEDAAGVYAAGFSSGARAVPAGLAKAVAA